VLDIRVWAVINTSNILTKVMAMNEHSRTTNDDEMAYRERATALLDEFAQQARGVLRDAGIGIDLIFLVPASGDVILTFGTAAELYSREWQTLRTTVSSLGGQIGSGHHRHLINDAEVIDDGPQPCVVLSSHPRNHLDHKVATSLDRPPTCCREIPQESPSDWSGAGGR
jgi:hypothetical protein